MEEGILRAFKASKILDIIHNQHIYRLIEIEEIGDTVIQRSVLVLQFKRVRTHVQHACLRVHRAHLISDSVCQVGLSYSASTVDEKRIKGSIARLFGNCHACSTGQLIRLTGNERIKRIVCIQLGVEMRYLFLRDNRVCLCLCTA